MEKVEERVRTERASELHGAVREQVLERKRPALFRWHHVRDLSLASECGLVFLLMERLGQEGGQLTVSANVPGIAGETWLLLVLSLVLIRRM